MPKLRNAAQQGSARRRVECRRHYKQRVLQSLLQERRVHSAKHHRRGDDGACRRQAAVDALSWIPCSPIRKGRPHAKALETKERPAVNVTAKERATAAHLTRLAV